MNWNEKIDLIKKKYPDSEFSVPHLNRKNILRQIETQFVQRNKNYYDLNNFSERFCNWWENIKLSDSDFKNYGIDSLLKKIYKPNQKCWIACEFPNQQILIYKSKISPAIDLLNIGQTWTKHYYIVETKFEYLVGLKIIKNGIELKFSGDKKSF